MTQAESDKTILGTTSFDEDARVDPHPKLKAIRETSPLLRDDTVKTWFFTTYDEVRTTVNDPTVPRGREFAEEGSLLNLMRSENEDLRPDRLESILMLDDPDHTRIRRPFMKAFYARINAMKDEIEGIVDDVINAAPESGEFDFVEQIALPIPILVIARIIGVDEAKLDEFREWSENVILSLVPLRTPEQDQLITDSGEKLEAYFSELLADRRENPREDLVTDMVQLLDSGADLTEEEVCTNLTALLVGGNLTTTDLIANGVWLFLQNPDQLEKLRNHPGLAGPAVEEVLRYEGPVCVTSRVIPDEREISGCPMHRGSAVFMSLHGANRDPNVFENPETFDITREHKPHVAFGGGSHICIGAPLARMEGKHAFKRIFERYPNLALSGDEVIWRHLPFFRGIEVLPVKAG